MYYLLIPVIVLGFGIFYKPVKNSYHNFQQLNKIVKKNHKGVGKVLCMAIEIIYKKCWFKFSHWINNTIERYDKNTSILTYYLDGRIYKIVLDHRKGPPLVLLVTDGDGEDVTTTVVPFLGPKRDWHKREFTPYFWEKSLLSFELSNGENKTFKNDEIIVLV
jgi:hypothetical protein